VIPLGLNYFWSRICQPAAKCVFGQMVGSTPNAFPTQQGEKVLTEIKAALEWHRSGFRIVARLTQVPKEKFYKKESQEKIPPRLEFSCFAAHVNEQDLF